MSNKKNNTNQNKSKKNEKNQNQPKRDFGNFRGTDYFTVRVVSNSEKNIQEHSTAVTSRLSNYLEKVEKSENVKITNEKSNYGFTNYGLTCYKITGDKGKVLKAEERLRNEMMKQFFVQNLDQKESSEQTGHYDDVTLVMEDLVFCFDEKESKKEFYLISTEKIEENLKNFQTFASKQLHQSERIDSETKNHFFKTDDLSSFNVTSLKKNMKDLIQGNEIYTSLGKIIFYNKDYIDLSGFQIDFETLKTIGLCHNNVLRTKKETTWKLSKLDSFKKYLESEGYSKETLTKKSVHVFHKEQKFYVESQNGEISTFLFDKKYHPTEFSFHDGGCDIFLTSKRRFSCPETFVFEYDFEKKIEKMFSIKSISSDIEKMDGIRLNELGNENLDYTYLMDLKFETKELFSKDDFIIEIKDNKWRKLIIEGEEENDLSNGVYIYSKKLKSLDEDQFDQSFEDIFAEIQRLFEFTNQIKQEFDKFE
jgi:hypothetical protein